ncbi:hypothetical protein D3C78_1049410 [compost metagenome]
MRARADLRLQPVAGLLQIVRQLQVIGAADRPGDGVVAVGLDIAPVAVRLEVIQLVAHGQPVVDLVLHAAAHALVPDGDAAIVGVEVAAPQFFHDAPVDRRRTEVARGLLVAHIGQQLEAQGSRGLPAQGAHQLAAAGAAHVRLAIRVVTVGIDAVAQRLAQRPGQAQAQAGRAIRARAQQHFAQRLAARLLAHDIGRGAGRARAVEDGGRAAQHFHPLVAPAVMGVRRGGRCHRQPHAVFRNADRIGAREAARAEIQAVVAGGTQRRHAHGSANDVGHAAVAAFLPGLAVDMVQAGRKVARGNAGAAAGSGRQRQAQPAFWRDAHLDGGQGNGTIAR